MSRRHDYHSNPQYGWNPTSPEYVEHITRMQRMPTVITDVPHFPDVHSALQNKVIYEEEQDDHHQQVKHHKHQNPEAKKTVHFAEQEKTTKGVKDGKDEVCVEKDINMAADGFIKQKHTNFELHKWATFKGGYIVYTPVIYSLASKL